MAHVPVTSTYGIQQSEGLLGQLFNYLNSLSGMTAAPQVTDAGLLPNLKGFRQTMGALSNAPMTTMPGGGVDPISGSNSYSSGLRLSGQPTRANIGDLRRRAQLGIFGQNLGLQQSSLFNNQSLQAMIDQLLSGVSSSLGRIGTYPPSLRGAAQSTAASGTGSGGGILGLFGL